MTVSALDIPDDPDELAAWLDRALVGLHLAGLVAELEAVHGAPTGREPGPTLERVAGDRLDALLAEGLAALPIPAIGRLLRHPRLLLDLQERIATEGGEHWARLASADAELARRAGAARPEIGAKGARPVVLPGPASRPGRGRRDWAVGLATAASLLLAFAGWEAYRGRGEPATFGWNRPGLLARDVAPAAYLRGLAEAAEGWLRDGERERPGDAPALARRIVEFRRGCTALIVSPKSSLAPADRAWLVERCRAWARRLDADLEAVEAAFESGGDPSKIREDADEAVRALIKALRARAAGLA